MNKTYSIDETATLLGVEAEDIQSCIDEGRLACLRVGKKIIITQTALDAFLETSTNLPTDLDKGEDVTVTLQQSETRKEANVMKGSITTLKGRKKPYMYQILIGVDGNGKKIRESKSFETRVEAEAAMNKRIAELTADIGNSSKKIETRAVTSKTLLADYMQYYLDLEPTAANSRTREGYYGAARCIARPRLDDGLGDLQLKELDDTLILKFFNKLKKRYAQTTLNKVYLVVNMALRYAFKKGYIKNDIMDGVKKPKSEIVTEKVEAYTDEELDTILTAAKNYPELYPIFVVLADTGMRPSELRALKWCNLDWNKRTIDVKGAIITQVEGLDLFDRSKKKKTEVLGPTKSKAGVRTVFLSDRAVDALKAWKAYISENPDFILARDEEYVFTTRVGGFVKKEALKSKYDRFINSAGLKGRGYTLYRFRHTFCTKLMNSGTSLARVKQLMGDSTLDVIVNNYSTVTDDDLRNTIDSLF